MARLFTCGFEVGYGLTAANALKGEDATIVNDIATGATVSSDTSIVRSGARSLKVVSTGAGGWQDHFPVTIVTSRKYHVRMCLYIQGFGTGANLTWPSAFEDGTNGIELYLTTAGVLHLAFASNDTIIVTGPTLSTGQWYVLEYSYVPSTGACELMVNGVSQGTGTCETSASTTFQLTIAVSPPNAGTHTMNYDDWALNDDQGSANNSWCGQGNVILLTPASDNATTGFTEGAGGTGSLFAATNTTPPTGKALASATNTSQIKDATSNTTDNYKPNLQTYTAAGVPAGATIVCAQGICSHGNSSTTSRTNGLQVVSNPTIAESTGTTGTTAAGTWPTGWTALKTANVDTPTVTLGTAPVMEFRKGTASTDSAMADLIGLYVEYAPGAGGGTPALTVPQLMMMGVGQ